MQQDNIIQANLSMLPDSATQPKSIQFNELPKHIIQEIAQHLIPLDVQNLMHVSKHR